MSHVDEGTLHAYVDGALDDAAERHEIEEHLRACAVCAGALDDARRLRDRAADMLSGSVATRDVPPFEQVLKRRARSTGGRLRRLRVIGLAATLALAVGVVWYARVGSGAGVAGAAGEAAAAAAEAAVGPAAAGAADTGLASEAAPPAAPRPSSATGRGQTARRQETDRIELADAPSHAGAREDREAEERAAEPTQPAPVVALEQIVVTAVPAQRAGDADRLLADRAAAAAAPAESIGLRLRGGISSDALGADWVAVSQDTAAAHLGGQPALVPDLPVIAYGIHRGDSARRVRVVQSLGDGTMIELIERRLPDLAAGRMIHLEAADVRGIASFLPDSAATVRIERDGYEIIGRANLPAESLRVLVGKIR